MRKRASKQAFGSAFALFMCRVLAAGPICKDGTPLDVQRLDGARGLGAIDRMENDWLSELEVVPLPSDNARGRLHAARLALRDWYPHLLAPPRG